MVSIVRIRQSEFVVRYFKTASKEYRKAKVIQKAYPENPSLKIFVESVLAKNITP
ncbi:MAG: hypothetical protein U5N85_12455 [Arcicella sp.]|nr:hypothetical protein [Arcicella sp.]